MGIESVILFFGKNFRTALCACFFIYKKFINSRKSWFLYVISYLCFFCFLGEYWFNYLLLMQIMNSEALCNMVDQMQLFGVEKITIPLPMADLCHADLALQNALLCKIFSSRFVDSGSFAYVMPRIWKVRDNVTISNVGRNIFLCVFQSIEEKNVVKEGEPWIFDQKLVFIAEPSSQVIFDQTPFPFMTFWVNVRNLPSGG